jgi:hypothetical protein
MNLDYSDYLEFLYSTSEEIEIAQPSSLISKVLFLKVKKNFN